MSVCLISYAVRFLCRLTLETGTKQPLLSIFCDIHTLYNFTSVLSDCDTTLPDNFWRQFTYPASAAAESIKRKPTCEYSGKDPNSQLSKGNKMFSQWNATENRSNLHNADCRIAEERYPVIDSTIAADVRTRAIVNPRQIPPFTSDYRGGVT